MINDYPEDSLVVETAHPCYEAIRVEKDGRLLTAHEVEDMLRSYYFLEEKYEEYSFKLGKYTRFFNLLKELLDLSELNELNDELNELKNDVKRTNHNLANHSASKNVHKGWL